MIRESLLKSVSVQELLQMRNNGLSNQQIADNLGVSYHTVLKYIGSTRKYTRHDSQKPAVKRNVAQPTRSDASRSTRHNQQEIVHAPMTTNADSVYGMKLVKDERIIELEGYCCSYTVHTNSAVVRVVAKGLEVTLDMQQCKHVARELGSIFGMLSDDRCQKLT